MVVLAALTSGRAACKMLRQKLSRASEAKRGAGAIVLEAAVRVR